MNRYIVIGAGVLGASTAYHLARLGADVVIVDGKHKGQATDAAAGIVCPWLSQRRNQAWYQLAKGGAKFYPELINQLEQEGETQTGYARVGAISLHKDPDKLAAMKKRALKRKEDAPEIGEVNILTPEQTKELFPPLADEFGSVHVSGAARVDGRALKNALIKAAVKLGAVIIEGQAELLHTGHSIKGVNVEGRKIYGDKVIVTAGAWAGVLLKPLAIDYKGHFQKAQIVHLRFPEQETGNWPVVMPPSDQYILSFDDRRIVIGATHENETGFDLRVTAGGLAEVFSKALEIAPGLSKAAFLEARVGFRPFTPGFLPVIGPVPEFDGILLVNGLGASGLTMGPFLGRELSKLAVGHETTIDLSLYELVDTIN